MLSSSPMPRDTELNLIEPGGQLWPALTIKRKKPAPIKERADESSVPAPETETRREQHHTARPLGAPSRDKFQISGEILIFGRRRVLAIPYRSNLPLDRPHEPGIELLPHNRFCIFKSVCHAVERILISRNRGAERIPLTPSHALS